MSISLQLALALFGAVVFSYGCARLLVQLLLYPFYGSGGLEE